jgi:pyruvate,water dikinase
LLSLVVKNANDFSHSLQRVIHALPRNHAGKPRGCVFVQPLVGAEEAGVAFFDGFYFERTAARESNESLTSGQARGDVICGQVSRDDSWSKWLQTVFAVFQSDRRIDIEFARDREGYVLLQSRPALFQVRRNPILSLTNHKEILGDPPSPWIASVVITAGNDLSFMAVSDPKINRWEECYAIGLAGRAWMNLSFWQRWMDHFGLPRTLVTRNFGGIAVSNADSRIHWPRFIRSIPALLRFQWECLATLPGLRSAFRRYDQSIEKASSLHELHAAMVNGLSLALRSNFAINAALAGILPIRKFLRIPGQARIVTQEMMESYRRLASFQGEQREAAFQKWIVAFGHRGPLESDPSRPRFAELRDVLRMDLNTIPADSSTPPKESWMARRFRWCFRIDEIREWFRDSLMRRWQLLRERILAEAKRLVDAGRLENVDDVFWLRREDLEASDLQEAVQRNRVEFERHAMVDVPLSATRSEIESLLADASRRAAVVENRRVFPGISLSPSTVQGVVRKANDLLELLRDSASLTSKTILVVPTLEPSWAVVFPRVAGVIADVGGELSHASILLRESRKPALVNCTGIYRQVNSGNIVRLDGAAGTAEVIDSNLTAVP